MPMSGAIKHKTHTYNWSLIRGKRGYSVFVVVDDFYGNWKLQASAYLSLDNDNRFSTNWSDHSASVTNNDGGDSHICADVFETFMYLMEKEYPFFFDAK